MNRSEMRKQLEGVAHDLYSLSQTVVAVRSRVRRVEIAILDGEDTDETMPKDRDELQKMLNDAYRKGSQDAHAAVKLLSEAFSLPIHPDPTKDAWNT